MCSVCDSRLMAKGPKMTAHFFFVDEKKKTLKALSFIPFYLMMLFDAHCFTTTHSSTAIIDAYKLCSLCCEIAYRQSLPIKPRKL